MIPYPATLPVDDIKLIISDILTSSEISDRVNFTKAVWELAGFALKSTIGEPGAPLTLHAHAFHLSDLEVVTHLQSIIAGQTILSQIPWAAIAKWALTVLLNALPSA